ncbi:hypothetical protein [Verminephrobacter eiseniae]|uniref:hypothetical protein n=1 Tax=Verminephrobacter eiseniae TaxID=364317 RepID=UPI002237BC36|nr:hypothetical protein [Verminephrobacter eiseniae]MCW5235821.1 hypothetical protein [Verminephrobacter eiseniae]
MRTRAQLNDLPPTSGWALARCTERMGTSVLREIRNVTEKSGITSLAGGLPFTRCPVGTLAALAAVLAHNGVATLQYAASAGFAPLREEGAPQMALQTLHTPIPFPHERC